jgi:hypothetical protein
MGKHIPGKPTVVVENMTGVLELLPVRSLIGRVEDWRGVPKVKPIC